MMFNWPMRLFNSKTNKKKKKHKKKYLTKLSNNKKIYLLLKIRNSKKEQTFRNYPLLI
jgi:hypothetical protein